MEIEEIICFCRCLSCYGKARFNFSWISKDGKARIAQSLDNVESNTVKNVVYYNSQDIMHATYNQITELWTIDVNKRHPEHSFIAWWTLNKLDEYEQKIAEIRTYTEDKGKYKYEYCSYVHDARK